MADPIQFQVESLQYDWDDFVGYCRMDTKQNHTIFARRFGIERELTKILIEGQHRSFLRSGKMKDISVLHARRVSSNPKHLVPFSQKDLYGGSGQIFVEEEPHAFLGGKGKLFPFVG
jgi:hypothetical protein